jgi:lipopolysaccharide transport system ATP-binding protein
MSEIAGSHGRTVLFVSHQLGMVSRLCSRAILLSGGAVVFCGPGGETIDRYVSPATSPSKRTTSDDPRIRQLSAAITRVECIGPNGAPVDEVAWRDPIRVRVEVVVKQRVGGMLLGIAIDNRHATRVTNWVPRVSDHMAEGAGRAELEVEIAAEIIAPGGYSFTAALFEPGIVYHRIEGECPIVIVDSGSDMAEFSNVDYGVAIIPATWAARDIFGRDLRFEIV